MTIQTLGDITSFKWATVTGVAPLAIRLDGDSSALALIPDSLIDPLELGIGDRVRVELSLRKCVIHGAASGGSGSESGDIKLTARATAQTGWLLCQGQSLLRSAYPLLFAAIGTVYGAADSTHFNIPDLRGRVAAGCDASQTEFDVLGEAGGSKTETLTEAQMPAHTHELTLNGTAKAFLSAVSAGSGVYGLQTASGSTPTAATKGGGLAHNNLQPYIVLNYIIKL